MDLIYQVGDINEDRLDGQAVAVGVGLQAALQARCALASAGASVRGRQQGCCERRLAANHEVLVTVEEGGLGGFGAHVLHMLAEDGLLDGGLKVRTMTLPDAYIDHDSPEKMYAAAGLDAKGIVAKVLAALGDEKGAARVMIA